MRLTLYATSCGLKLPAKVVSFHLMGLSALKPNKISLIRACAFQSQKEGSLRSSLPFASRLVHEYEKLG